VRLTKKYIETFVYEGIPPQRDVRWDDDVSGFGIRIYPSGKKAFVLSYRINNRKHLLTIGDFGILTLDQARKLAKQECVKVLNNVNPLDNRKLSGKEQTMRALCEAYLSRYSKIHKKTWKEDERRINKHILPKWGSFSIKSISRSDIASFHAQIGKAAPYEANRILRLLSKMFSLAGQWGFVEEVTPNPAKSIRLLKEEKRDRWLRPEELPQLVDAIEQEPNKVATQAVWLYLLTGARKSELLQAKWDDIDWERKELRIAETKAGRIHYIPLIELACQLLKSIQSIKDNPYIFPGNVIHRPLVNITKPWKRICAKAGLEDIRLHDIRRTVGSWLAQSGNSLHLIGKILNHSNQSTTATYARFAQDQGRTAMEEYGRKLMASSKTTITSVPLITNKGN
jgi:integrase